jgi:predicted DNA-binding protein (MmcQ/YjbR family)
MYIDEFRAYCLTKKGVTEDTPFGPDTLVLKVMNKIFAITGIDKYDFVNLKCDPEYAAELREREQGIKPGWHMNKTHWNSVMVDGTVSEKLFKELIDHSYNIIVASLPKKLKEELAGMG